MKWMNSIKDNWRWAVLNLLALTVMVVTLWQVIRVEDFKGNYDSLLVSSGKWAIRFLLLSLLMTPLNTLFGWRSAVKLRKSAGLWAFSFGAVHFLANLATLKAEWLNYPIPDYIAAFGLIGLGILTLMALTSTQWAMKRMGKWWKRLHRMVYAAGIIILIHAFLESPNKRVFFLDPQAVTEIGLYMGILALLLIARIPRVRTVLSKLKHSPANRKGSVV